MKVSRGKVNFWGKKFYLTRIFHPTTIPAASRKIIIRVLFLLLFSVLSIFTSSPCDPRIINLEEMKSLLSLHLHPAKLATVWSFWPEFSWREKHNRFSLMTSFDGKNESLRRRSRSEYPVAFSSAFDERKNPLSAWYFKERVGYFKDGEILKKNQEKGEKKEAEAQGEILKPDFKNIKEKIGVYSFLLLLWLIIGVLLYIINEQIKEAERRRRLGL